MGADGPSMERDEKARVEAIGSRIRTRRELLGIGQAELADRVKLRAQTVWRYEHGRAEPKATIMSAIARELQTTAKWLVAGDDVDAGESGEDRSGDPPYPAWAEFVGSKQYQMAEPWMLDNLRGLRVPPGHQPTVETYRHLLYGMLAIEGEDA